MNSFTQTFLILLIGQMELELGVRRMNRKVVLFLFQVGWTDEQRKNLVIHARGSQLCLVDFFFF